MKTQTGQLDPRQQQRGFDWDKYEEKTGRPRVGERLGPRETKNPDGDISGADGRPSERPLGGVVLNDTMRNKKIGEVPTDIPDRPSEPRLLEEVGKA